jgi:hypothetical protein
MQRASDIGARIMDGPSRIPSDEKPGFLASFAFYVSRDTTVRGQAAEMSGFLPSFVAYAPLRMTVVSRSDKIAPREYGKRKDVLWQYPDWLV